MFTVIHRRRRIVFRSIIERPVYLERVSNPKIGKQDKLSKTDRALFRKFRRENSKMRINLSTSMTKMMKTKDYVRPLHPSTSYLKRRTIVNLGEVSLKFLPSSISNLNQININKLF